MYSNLSIINCIPKFLLVTIYAALTSKLALCQTLGQEAVGPFVCPPNHVLTVVDFTPSEAVYMHCRQVPVCEEILQMLQSASHAAVKLFLHNQQGPFQYMVNDIAKTPDGYKVTACDTQCEDTTTTRDPTTEQQPTEQPEQNPLQNPAPIGNDVRADAAGAGALCFSGDSLVVTKRRGTQKLQDLDENDQIATNFDKKGNLIFEDIEYWLHRDNAITAEFLKLSIEQLDTANISATSNTYAITLTEKHLIATFPCAKIGTNPIENVKKLFDYTAKFAFRAKLGECVIVADKINGILTLGRIQQINTIRSPGVFAPVTKSGVLLVDDVMASCFSSVESHFAARALSPVMGTVLRWVRHFWTTADEFDIARHVLRLAAFAVAPVTGYLATLRTCDWMVSSTTAEGWREALCGSLASNCDCSIGTVPAATRCVGIPTPRKNSRNCVFS